MLHKTKLSAFYLAFFTGLITGIIACSNSDQNTTQEPSPSTPPITKPKVSFNEVVYNQVSHEFIAAGEEYGKPLLISSFDGLTWKKHNVKQVGTISSLVVNDKGLLYYTLEIPGTTDNSVYRLDNYNPKNYIWKPTLQENYKAYEHVVKSVKNYRAIYELRTIDGKIFRVYRILINPQSSSVSPPTLIYTGKNITDIECDENDSSILLLKGTKEILASKSPDIPNSFTPTNPIKSESQVISETIASGIILVSKARIKNSESNVTEIYYAFNEKKDTWEEIQRFNFAVSYEDEFSSDVNLNYESDSFIDLDRNKNDIPELVIGSLTGKRTFAIESYPKDLPTIAQRTCAAGAIINGENIIVLLGDDNKILRSRDNKNWQVIIVQ